jgi:phosphonate transport system substrate-binding protein
MQRQVPLLRLSILLLLLAACSPASASEVIRLSDLQPLEVQTRQVAPLRLAVAAVLSAQSTAETYQPLLDYLSARLERPVELVQRRTYAEINQLIEDGEVDVAFVCTAAYVAGYDQFGMQLLAAPQVKGATVYYSYLIVPADSPAQTMADLRGGAFAFTDPLSTTGRMYPTYLVQQLGASPEGFFSRSFFTYSHDEAIRAVASGVADGAAVDSLVYDSVVSRDPALGEQVRVIDQSPPFGIPPVVVGPAVRPQLAAQLAEVLMGMSGDPEGSKALAAMQIEAFVPIEDSAYDSVRALLAGIGDLQP